MNSCSITSVATATERLRRYLDDELGECRPEDVDRRLEDLGALAGALSEERVATDVAVLSALSSETRYAAVRVLVAAGEELCVCELNAVVDASESAVSHALSELDDAGLVEGRTDGRWRKYRATDRAVALVTVLDGAIDE